MCVTPEVYMQATWAMIHATEICVGAWMGMRVVLWAVDRWLYRDVE
jgi:type III secretory pathway component EscT